MENLTHKIVDVISGKTEIIDFTEEEVAKVEEIKAQRYAENIEMEKNIAERKAILEKLGLTEKEANLLLG